MLDQHYEDYPAPPGHFLASGAAPASAAGGWQCSLCPAIFLYWGDLQTHEVTQHAPRHECLVCGAHFPSEEALRRHAKQHSLEHAISKLASNPEIQQVPPTTHPQPAFPGNLPAKLARKYGQHTAKAPKVPSKPAKPPKSTQAQQKKAVIRVKAMHKLKSLPKRVYKTKTSPATVKVPKKRGRKKKPIYDESGQLIKQEKFFCCGKKFLSKERLDIHIRTHDQVQNREPLSCDFCKKTMTTRQLLYKHMIVSHLKMFKCKFCKKKYVSKEKLARHKLKCEKLSVFDCKECNRNYKSKCSLQYHINLRHSVRFVCKFCGRGFATELRLLDHERRHLGEYPYKCDLCSKQYASKSSLRLHIQNHMVPKRFFLCDVCSRSFRSNYYLKVHRQSHFDETPQHVCNICNMVCTTKDVLARHMSVHSREKPYECDLCGKCFARKSYVQRHKKEWHIGVERKLPCPYCPKMFARSTYLNRHLRTHTGERPHACPICDQRFKQTSQLHTHQWLKHKLLPYSCSVCGERFKVRADLMDHVIEHGITPVNYNAPGMHHQHSPLAMAMAADGRLF